MNKFTEHWPVKQQIEKKRNINLARDSQTQILELQQTRREKMQETAKRIDEANLLSSFAHTIPNMFVGDCLLVAVRYGQLWFEYHLHMLYRAGTGSAKGTNVAGPRQAVTKNNGHPASHTFRDRCTIN